MDSSCRMTNYELSFHRNACFTIDSALASATVAWALLFVLIKPLNQFLREVDILGAGSTPGLYITLLLVLCTAIVLCSGKDQGSAGGVVALLGAAMLCEGIRPFGWSAGNISDEATVLVAAIPILSASMLLARMRSTNLL